jgi:hypothetical protein
VVLAAIVEAPTPAFAGINAKKTVGGIDDDRANLQVALELIQHLANFHAFKWRRQELGHVQLQNLAKDGNVLRRVKGYALYRREFSFQLAADELCHVHILNIEKNDLRRPCSNNSAKILRRGVVVEDTGNVQNPMRNDRLLKLFPKLLARADKNSSHGLNI